MFKFALLAAIAAAADSDATTDAKTTYSGDGVTVQDTDSNGLMTTPLSFEITTAEDSVTTKSTVGATLVSGEWGAAGSAIVTVCVPVPSNTDYPFECRTTTNGSTAGSFILFNSAKIADAPTDVTSTICTIAWTIAKANDSYEATFPDMSACETAGVTIDSKTGLTMDSKSWTFVATYANSKLSDDAATTYSTDLNAGMKEVNVKGTVAVTDSDPAMAGTKQETIDLTASSDDSGAAALSAFGVALAASFLF